MFDKLQLKKALFMISLLGTTFSLSAQEVSVRRGAKRRVTQESKTLNLSRRAINQGLNLKKDGEHRRWEKVIYRFLDLNQAENAALYYAGNEGKQENLFSQLFKLINNKELKAYEYLDGVELYDDKHQLDFKALLDRFQIPYRAKTRRGRGAKQTAIEVENNDIPSSEVRAYYVKEVWYFDQAKSDFDVSIEAICPIMFGADDEGGLTYPLFWLPYDKLRPYINTDLVMLDDTNNIAEATLDDFFTMRMYKGDIVKVKNLLNKSLVQQVGLDSIQAKRDSIEQGLKKMETVSFATSPMMKLKAGEEDSDAEVLDTNKENSRDKRIKKGKKSKKKKASKRKKHRKSKKSSKKTKRSSSKSVRGRF